MDSGLGFGLVLLLTVLGIALAVAWVLLPFAMFGTKPILRDLLEEQRRTNALLREMRDAGQAGRLVRPD